MNLLKNTTLGMMTKGPVKTLMITKGPVTTEALAKNKTYSKLIEGLLSLSISSPRVAFFIFVDESMIVVCERYVHVHTQRFALKSRRGVHTVYTAPPWALWVSNLKECSCKV